jgi:hypothetical protein
MKTTYAPPKPRWFDPGSVSDLDLMSWMLGFCIACVLSTGLMLWITVANVRDRNEAIASEKQAWEQVQTLRATVALMKSGQGIEEF